MGVFQDSGFKVTSIFGPRTQPLKGTPEFHKGIDLVIADKAPLPSFTDGKVLHAGWGDKGTGLGDMGNVVAIQETGTDHCHVYAHLDSVAVKTGDMVKVGQHIGNQGNTGASAGSHLHYEIRKKSTPSFGWTPSENDRINPEIYWAGKKLPSKPTAAAPVAKPAATVVAAKTYTVKSGDTLGKIATDNKMTLDELLKKNPEIKNASQVSIGQIIKL